MFEELLNLAYPLAIIPFITLFYPFYLLTKKDTPADQFFLFFGDIYKEEYLVDYLPTLEKEQKKNYQPHRNRIRSYFKGRRLSSTQQKVLEKIIIHSYFENFQSRWVPYRKADWVLRFLFLVPLILVSIVFFHFLREHFLEGGLTNAILYLFSTLLFVIPTTLFLAMYNAVFTLYLSFMAMAFSSCGRIHRASKTFDQMLFSLLPKRRKTNRKYRKKRRV